MPCFDWKWVTVRAIPHHSVYVCSTFPLVMICCQQIRLTTVAGSVYTNCTTGKSNTAFSLCSFKGAPCTLLWGLALNTPSVPLIWLKLMHLIVPSLCLLITFSNHLRLHWAPWCYESHYSRLWQKHWSKIYCSFQIIFRNIYSEI